MPIPTADRTAEIIDKAMHPAETTDIEGPEPLDCVQEAGFDLGRVEARQDLATQTVGDLDPASAMAASDDWRECAPETDEAPFEDIHIPSLSHPVVTALDIMLTPTEANGPEVDWLAQRDFDRDAPGAFQTGYQEGYSQEAGNAFDQQLDERLAIDFGPGAASPPFNPETVDPYAIDIRIPPLTTEVPPPDAPVWGDLSGPAPAPEPASSTEPETASASGGGWWNTETPATGSSDLGSSHWNDPEPFHTSPDATPEPASGSGGWDSGGYSGGFDSGGGSDSGGGGSSD